jgi:hypothetical protein
MKKYIYAAALFASSLSMNSCVSLDQDPQSFLRFETFPKDASNLASAADALYVDLWNGNYGLNCRLQRINVGADDVTYRAAKPNNPLALIEDLYPNITQNDADFSTLWSLFTKAIYDSGKIITETPVNEADNSKEAVALRAVVGEAYFVRGLSYFYLVRLFGDLPLILTPEDAEKKDMQRVAVADIYDKAIVPDMERAVKWLPATSRTKDASTPSKWAAEAALGDIYMTMAGWPLNKGKEYYAKAESVLGDAIQNSGLKLATHYADLWKEANKTTEKEFLFGIMHSNANKKASNYGKSYYPSDFAPNAGWSDYYASEKFYLAYPNDERKAHNFMTEWNTKKGVVNYKKSADKLPAISKYYDYNDGLPGKSAQSNGITCIYRYADILLMYAEASVRATNSVSAKATNALQEVQKRAQGYADDATVTTTTNPSEFLDAVFDENGWEFFAEMRRWFDLVRLEKLKDVKPTEWANSLFKANNHYYFPVPYTQIELTNWANNAGY